MLTVEDYGRIRRAYRDGMSIRAIARTLHHSRRKIREVLANPEPRPYSRTKDPPAPTLGPFKPIIDQILKADQKAPRKQQHTAAQIFRCLGDRHDYRGGYDQVRRYVAKHRRQQRETFIPLVHEPGQRLECDFGHIYVDFPQGRRQVPTIAAEFDKLAREAAEANEGYQQYLLRLTELEVATRSTNALRARIKAAAFAVHKDVDTYDFSVIPTASTWSIAIAGLLLLTAWGTGNVRTAMFALGAADRWRPGRSRAAGGGLRGWGGS